MKKRVLFIDRDGTIAVEPPIDCQLDSLDKLKFVPRVIGSLSFLRARTDYEFVMVSNQDGLGTASFPEETFWPSHNLILDTLKGEGVVFDDILIDRSMPADNAPTRKPRTGMMGRYLTDEYSMSDSLVIGDRATDVELAYNMGCKAILLSDNTGSLPEHLRGTCVFCSTDWWSIAQFIFAEERTASVHRKTGETDIFIEINVDGSGKADISTGLGFFDHMLSQIARHGGMDLTVKSKGDLNTDEHHTIEDTGIVLGQCLLKALGSKRGIERYGYCLPMDDCLCQVALDFGGRPWLVWDAVFNREKIGDMPTEMFMHFFKSMSDAALMNLNIKAEGTNEHHKIEGIFKAFAKALKMAVKRDVTNYSLPSTKGTL